MEESPDTKFMRRCIELAGKAEGQTLPNPLVGSVVVHRGKIIGEGYHLRPGMPHAEVNALNSVSNATLLKDSTVYVNLEPCSHFGKTPPCANFLIEKGIRNVVVGTVDTSSKVNGKGIALLQEAGVKVTTGILEEESRWINRRFFTFHEKKRPWIVLKWAQSADGFLDKARSVDDPGPAWITGPAERVLVHRWRSQEQSILVGAGTLRLDAPSLNVREWTGSDPLRLVLTGSGNVKPFRIPGRSVVFTHNANVNIKDADVVLLNDDKPSCRQVCDYLFNSGLQSLFIEGGATILNHFIENGMWDEARVFTGKQRFGSGVKAPMLSGKPAGKTEFSGSTLETYVNR